MIKTRVISFPQVLAPTRLQADITLVLPPTSQLPTEQQHFLLFIPWNEFYLNLVPVEFREFFQQVLPHLNARTTDVHTAVSMSFLDELLQRLGQPINRRVVALSLILHDSGWSKLTEQEIATSLGVSGLKLTAEAIGPKEKHAIVGAELAREILTKNPLSPALNPEEIDLICKAILYHDKPEAVAGAAQPMPLEVQALVDLDHLWSFTYQNFWQDTVRKGVAPAEYLQNLENDLDGYFVTHQGRELARELLSARAQEVSELV